MTLGFTGIKPMSAGVANHSIASFSANGTGQLEPSASAPEPSSWLMATIGGLTLVGYQCVRRRSIKLS
jgi:hypothetical protein